jgi:hypothetical protein
VPDPEVSIAAKLCFLGCNGGAVRLVVLSTGRSGLAAGLGMGGVLVVARLLRILVGTWVKRGRWRGEFSSERCGQEVHDWALFAVTL